MHRTIFCAFAVGALLLPVTAGAAACCLSAGVFGVGRLAAWEELVVGSSIGVSRAQGLWNADGGFRAYGDGYQELEGTAELYGLLRIDERFQSWARLPWLITHRAAGSYSELGQGLGDLQLGLRYDPVLIGEYEELPAIALTASVLAPTGLRPEDAATRVTGPALDFCLLVTQRRHRADLALVVTGPVADEWLDVAQVFAGPPGDGRPPSGGTG